MKKLVLIAFLFLAVNAFNLNAQVTIGSDQRPDVNAVLDLQSDSKGLLLPRVELKSTVDADPTTTHTRGLTVYNTAYTTDLAVLPEHRVSPGFYYNDGSRWAKLSQGYSNWFYMPSVEFDTSAPGVFEKELYQLYYDQFKQPKVKSVGSPASIPFIPSNTDMYYYITDYDETVFSDLTISATGKLTYTVNATTTDCSFINIIFVLK